MAKLPASKFLTTRLKEYDPDFEVRSGTGFESLFFKPVQFIAQPIIDEIAYLQVAQSLRRIQQQVDPDAFDEDAVDAIISNVFVYRFEGNRSGGTARIYYSVPVDREWPQEGIIITGSNGKTYTNPAPFMVLRAQTSAQIENGTYYYDITVECTELGDDGDLDQGGLVAVENDTEAVTVTNKDALGGGKPRETNTQLIDRAKRSISVRDLVVGKGFNATMFENYGTVLTELQPIGMGDDEMMRDIMFNTHIGGKIDGYVKTINISEGYKDVVGLLTDLTRQAHSTTNIQLDNITWTSMGQTNVDRTGDKEPVVKQVKAETAAYYRSTVDLTNPVNLSTRQHVKLIIDGSAKNVKVAGVIPATTTRSEIILKINRAFGFTVATAVGNTIEVRSPTKGLSSEVVIADPDFGGSAIEIIFGLTTDITIPPITPRQYVYTGEGPIIFTDLIHYEIADEDGNMRRVVGISVVNQCSTGSTILDDATFIDLTPNKFVSVAVNDIITINPNDPATKKDYRILSKTDSNTIELDDVMPSTASGVEYFIKRTGIKHEEVVEIEFWYNPLSIDIGPYVKLDEYGKTRGIREGREDQTITDVPLLRIKQILVIDPVTHEPTGIVLQGGGGYGYGGYGEGPYGIGAGVEWYLVVNSPTERFSMFEDSLIVLNSGLIGLSFRVEYEYVPEIAQMHEFARSANERVLDGDILMKHFLPAYVKGTIEYKVDTTDSTIPDNETLTGLVKEFISAQRSGTDLKFSDIYQFISRVTDPYNRFGTYIRPFQLTSNIHNTDGSLTIVSGDDTLIVPTPDPAPKDTPAPLSSRIVHWIGDEIVLSRLS